MAPSSRFECSSSLGFDTPGTSKRPHPFPSHTQYNKRAPAAAAEVEEEEREEHCVWPPAREREKEVYSSSHEKMEKGGWWGLLLSLSFSSQGHVRIYAGSLSFAVTLGLKEEEEDG